MRALVTGGAGFIGSALVEKLVHAGSDVLTIDKLTYAGHRDNLASVGKAANHAFIKADITDAAAIGQAFAEFDPDCVLHLAAETHVDRSIDGPRAFVDANIVGAFTMLEAALAHGGRHGDPGRVRFVHISTDEVYGALGEDGAFREDTPYQPNSPYSASKAAANHLARAWWRTYGLPVVTTNGSNTYGPRQHAEKLIPTVIHKALSGEAIPIYGDGQHVRDWLYVGDHVDGILAAAERGAPGEVYNIGGGQEHENIALARLICTILDSIEPRHDGRSYAEQITLVSDRPGHDRRYAVDWSKAHNELGWSPRRNLEAGLRDTIQWYAARHNSGALSGANGARLGLSRAS